MNNPEIVIYKQDENKFFLYELESVLYVGPFKTTNEAKNNIDAFTEIVLKVYEIYKKHHIEFS